MDVDSLTVSDDPHRDEIHFLEERIYEYNVAATGITDGRLLSIFVRDEHDAIVAGLFGWTWGGCLEVENLWVREDWRGKGYGTRLLAAAEREAVARGCRRALLGTHSFQAPDFYRRLGYQIYGVMDDYPEGHKQYVLTKHIG